MTKTAEKLAQAADEYFKEVNNSVPDFVYRRTLWERLRKALDKYRSDNS